MEVGVWRETQREGEKHTQRNSKRERQRKGERTRTRKLYFTREGRETHSEKLKDRERERGRHRETDREWGRGGGGGVNHFEINDNCPQQSIPLTSLSVERPWRGVLTSPGWMQVTLTPVSASSALMACDSPSTKNLEPEYTARPGKPCQGNQTFRLRVGRCIIARKRSFTNASGHTRTHTSGHTL